MTPSTERTDPMARLLVAAPNWLGDAVMVSPLLDVLAAARDEAGKRPEIILAIRRRWSCLYDGDPRVQEILPVERTGRHGGVAGVARLAADWRSARCRGIALGPPSLRAGLAARLAGIQHRVGYRSDGRGLLLSRALPVPLRGDSHHADELAELGRELLAATGLEPGRATGSGEALPACRDIPARAAAGAPLWVFAPGTTYGEAKVWPLRPAADFVADAVGRVGKRVVMLGDTGATAAAAELARAAGAARRRNLDGGPGVVDLTGRTDLTEVVAVLKTAEAFVGNDSGLMHLAAALGVPTVGIFGSSNPDWTAPRGPWTAVVAAEGFPCRPCYRRNCDQPVFCLDEISGVRVMEEVVGLLERRRKVEG